jgi:hypothetical protein
MHRKSLVIAVVLLLAGLMPATAIAGFCARMPCCAHHTAGTPALSGGGGADCCTTIDCYQSPAATIIATAAMPALAVLHPLPPLADRAVAPAPIDPSPPRPPGDRLAMLATLLI